MTDCWGYRLSGYPDLEYLAEAIGKSAEGDDSWIHEKRAWINKFLDHDYLEICTATGSSRAFFKATPKLYYYLEEFFGEDKAAEFRADENIRLRLLDLDDPKPIDGPIKPAPFESQPAAYGSW